jgi:hypothetical protein
MSYSFELLPDEPILIATMYDSFSIKHDAEAHLSELASILDGLDQRVCYISDIRALKINVFQDFLAAVSKAFRGNEAVIKHPNITTTIIVSTAELIKLSAKGLNTEVFGHLSLPVFDTLDEALAYARSLIKQE